MIWFKYVVFAIFVGSAIISIAHTRKSYQPTKSEPYIYALCAVLDTLCAICVWVWL